MPFRYLVLGAGPLGQAAAYDLGAFGEADEVAIADPDAALGKEAAARVSKLLKKSRAKIRAIRLDPAKKAELAQALRGRNGVLSSLPADTAAAVAQAAAQAKAHYADISRDPAAARAVSKLQAAAKKAGVSLVSGAGLEPGLASCLALSAMTTLDFARDARVYSGAFSEKPSDSLDLGAGADPERILSLYLEPSQVLRRGRIETTEALEELETLEVSGVGPLEACLTGGESSSCPASFQARLVGYDHKTIRHPGHFVRVAAIRDMGFLRDKPVAVEDQKVVPRDLFLALARGAAPDEKDLVVLRVLVHGKKQGRPTEVAYELVDRFDGATRFSAAERTTAFPAAAALALQAKGRVKPGADPVELALPPRELIAEVRRRGLKITEAIRASAPVA